MTIEQMRALLGLGSEVSDADVLAAYDVYLAGQPQSGPSASPTTLQMRYPAFAGVATETIAYWLADALRIVTDAWGSDAEPAQMALAAHNMVLADVTGLTKTEAEQLPAGVTRFRSASMDVAVSESAANRSVSGGYASTRYGQEFAVMLRRNAGGPFLAGCV